MSQQAAYGPGAIAIDRALSGARGAGSLGLLGRLIRYHPVGMAGLLVVVLITLLAIFAQVLAPYDPAFANILVKYQGPSAAHLLGTDQLGRDVFSRVIYGARVSIVVGLLAVLLAMVVGTAIGVTAAYYGRWVELFTMRGIDILMTYPTILLAILIVAFFGTALTNVIIAIAITRIPAFARVAHGMTLSVKEKEFVEAARVLGAVDLQIGNRHILPNILAPLVVVATLEVAVAILIEASLGYLGLSVQAPTPTWGSMIQDGRGVLDRAPWIANSAGVMIFVLVTAINLMGDGLRDFLDPKAVSARRVAASRGAV
jgi:ABC-type dipeptide/oligopeptide/nickel transport system permease subunit